MSLFQFKQFNIEQRESVFKIGTDAVLLGALAGNTNQRTALEIGCGGGVISLMLAQRHAELEILAIDSSTEAIELADLNFKNSAFSNRLSTLLMDVRIFNSNIKYDLIVSNPPFLNNSTPSKILIEARHTTSLSHQNIVSCCKNNLRANGEAWFILPPKEMTLLVRYFSEIGLYPQRKYLIQTRPNMPITRHILSFSNSTNSFSISEELICLRDENHQFSDIYRSLTQAFHPFF